MVLAFGNHRLDIERRELRCVGALVALEPKAFDLLAYLVLQRDHVVSKDDLLAAVWGGLIVSDSAITTRINAVRRAIGDDGSTQRLIRTFNRKGVRFVGEVALVSDAIESVVGTASRPGSTAADKPSIAVLPFQNLSGDPGQEYFADGMVEEIITALSRIRWLFVIARNSSFTYRGQAIDVKQVGRELGVRYLLEGSVRKAANRVRIIGQLIDAATGAHLWADRFDGRLDDIFDLQDQVTSGVVGAIEPKLRLAEIERASRKPTQSLDAYDLYLRARAESRKRTREGHAAAIRLARKALECDPAYAPAMAQIANCRVYQLARGWIPTSGPEVEEGVATARQAIAAARDDPEILQRAGYALGFLAGENETALHALDRGITLNPNDADAFGHRALVLAWLNRPDEAITSAEQAIRLSPQHPATFAFYIALGIAHMAAGRYEESLAWNDRALHENAGSAALRLKLSLLGHLGRREEAEECPCLLRETHPNPTVAAMMREMPRRYSPELATRLAEGLRKAGLPEE